MIRASIIASLRSDSRGVSTTEFGILIGVFALASLQVLSSIGGEVEQNLDHTSTQVGANRTNADPFAKAGASQANTGYQDPGAGTDPFEPAVSGSAPADAYEPPVAAASIEPDSIQPDPVPSSAPSQPIANMVPNPGL